MSRVAGVNIPSNKKLHIALTYIYGIGGPTAEAICKQADIEAHRKVYDLSDAEIIKLREVIDKRYKVEGDLRKEVQMNIKSLIEIKSYRGLRHIKKLPCRGQRTHTNARTRRGKAKAIAGKKKVAK